MNVTAVLIGFVAGVIITAILTEVKKANQIKKIQKVLDEISEVHLEVSPATYLSQLSYETRTTLYHLADKLNVIIKEAGLKAGRLL